MTINPDGSVIANIGTQDLGVGTRTCVGIVVAESLGLPLEAVQVNIGQQLVSSLRRLRRQHDDRRHFVVVAACGDRGARRAVEEGRRRAEDRAGQARSRRRQNSRDRQPAEIDRLERRLQAARARCRSRSKASTRRRSARSSPAAASAACRSPTSRSISRPAW